jgi:septum formation protein
MIDESHPLLLGSASPRRREILTTLGLPLRIVALDVDERVLEGEGPAPYMERIAASKLRAAVVHAQGVAAVLVADTSVILDGRALGKPENDDDAAAMIRALAGREHEVWTRFAIARAQEPDRVAFAETVRTKVVFRSLEADEIGAYVATGEGRDKAGAYAIQGVGAFAVARIEGSYSNVVGLPACEVIQALGRLGLLGRFPRVSVL